MKSMNSKHAFLIMARSYSLQLNMLLEALDYPDNEVYLHVDRKNNYNIDRRYVSRYSKIIIITSTDVNWGGYSLINAELALLRASIPRHYQYYHLLSESDLPIKSNQEIHNFFDESGKEFVELDSLNAPCDIRRIKYYFPLQEYAGKHRGIIWLVQKCYMYLQQLVGVNRLRYHEFSKLGKGSNWFSITDECAQYVVSCEKQIQSIFRNGQAADELFMQTLILNSQFKNRLAGPNFGASRYILWNGASSPAILSGDNDLQRLIKSSMMFARKFDYKTDRLIIKKVLKMIK